MWTTEGIQQSRDKLAPFNRVAGDQRDPLLIQLYILAVEIGSDTLTMGVEDWSIANAIEGPIPSDRILFTLPVEGLLLNAEESIWSTFTWIF